MSVLMFGRITSKKRNKMKLTKQAKTEFEKWYIENRFKDLKKGIYQSHIELFNSYPDSMKYGVYVDWLDSVGIYISINPECIDNWFISVLAEDIMSPFYELCNTHEKPTRHEARTKAIELANEIFNERNA